ncbi:MAG TPA: hypothetical protein VGP33_06000, partial [Chloroflexota bacterium]|nr:hypothetical protein [Chloroflexota bacterium]
LAIHADLQRRRRGPIAAAAVLVNEGWSVNDALRRVGQARRQTAPTPDQLCSLRRFARGRLHHRLVYAFQEFRHPHRMHLPQARPQ